MVRWCWEGVGWGASVEENGRAGRKVVSGVLITSAHLNRVGDAYDDQGTVGAQAQSSATASNTLPSHPPFKGRPLTTDFPDPRSSLAPSCPVVPC